MKILVLSPHRGDAAFSLALSLAQWLKAGHAITILNCFSRSLDAPFSDAEFTHPNDRLSYVSAMRKREDEAFLRQLSPTKISRLAMIDLNLKDAPIRLQCSTEEAFGREVNPQDPAILKIGKAIARLHEEGSVDALVLPLALGAHVDHGAVLHAGLPFAAQLPCALYEDLPDATHPGVLIEAQALRMQDAALSGQALTPVINMVPSAAAAKRKLISRYVSQLDEAILEAIATFTVRYEGERLWANHAWGNIAADAHLGAPVETRPPR